MDKFARPSRDLVTMWHPSADPREPRRGGRDAAHFTCSLRSRWLAAETLARAPRTSSGASRARAFGDLLRQGTLYWSDPPMRRVISCDWLHWSAYLAASAPLQVIFQNDCSCWIASFLRGGFSSAYAVPRLK